MKRERNKYINIFIILIVVSLLLVLLRSSFALLDPIRTVVYKSSTLSYDTSTEGSWQLSKSAYYIDKSKVNIEYNLTTIPKYNTSVNDIILVLDTDMVSYKEEINRFIDSFIENTDKSIALITMNRNTTIESGFTRNATNLKDIVNDISKSNTYNNYYGTFNNIKNILDNSDIHKADIIYISNGISNINNSLDLALYEILNDEYQDITFSLIKIDYNYEIDSLLSEFDNTIYSTKDNLTSRLSGLSGLVKKYNDFTIKEYINTDYLDNVNLSNITNTTGYININDNIVTWDLHNIESGSTEKLNIIIDTKDIDENPYKISTKTEFDTKIDNSIEDIESTNEPVLKDKYKVTYNDNIPSTCSSTINGNENVQVYDYKNINYGTPTCNGYDFIGWEVVDSTVNQYDSNLYMPEKDITVKGTWIKLNISKSMDGTLYEAKTSVLSNNSLSSTFSEYLTDITKVSFKKSIKNIDTYEEKIDLSLNNDNSVIGYLVLNDDNTTYTLYVMGDDTIYSSSLSLKDMFNGMSNLTTIENINYLDISNATTMEGMFKDCSSLTSISLNGLSNNSITSMKDTFNGCSSLTSISFGGLDTVNVNTYNSTFKNCSSLSTLNTNYIKTANATDVSYMFSGLNNMSSLDLTGFNLHNITTAEGAFKDSTSLRSITITNSNVSSSLTNTKDLFSGCSLLDTISITNYNTSNVTNMSGMFKNTKMEELNLTLLSTSSVTNMSSMFENSSYLRTIYISSSTWNTDSVTNSANMFNGCTSIVGANGTTYDVNNIDKNYAHHDYGEIRRGYLTDTRAITGYTVSFYSGLPGYHGEMPDQHFLFNEEKALNYNQFTYKNANAPVTSTIYWALQDNNSDNTNETLIISDHEIDGELKGSFAGNTEFTSQEEVPWIGSLFDGEEYDDSLSKYVTNVIVEGIVAPTSTAYWFLGVGYNAETFEANLQNLITNNVTNMASMFKISGFNATIFNIDLSDFNTSNVVNMSEMFSGSGNLSATWNIGDLSNWDTSSVTNINAMFAFAGWNSTIFNLDLSNWNTSNVINMMDVFRAAGYNARTWNIGNIGKWDTSNVTDMSWMFSNAGQYAFTFNLDLSNWDTSSVTNMEGIFSYAGFNSTTLNLNLSGWNTGNVTDMSGMFAYAGYNSATLNLNLCLWNTQNVTNMIDMFNHTGNRATNWQVKISCTNGRNGLSNGASIMYGNNTSIYATADSGKTFTLVC